MEDSVVLVDANDRVVGRAPKLEVHEQGRLHRAFSVFVFDRAGRVLLQQRAPGKYHSGRLWTNTCCGHPRPGEPVAAAGRRRLREEMGFACPLQEVHAFVYRAEVGNGLIEHEYDHVLVGRFDGTPQPAPGEAMAWRWSSVADVRADLARHPDRYTKWLAPALAALCGDRPTNAPAGSGNPPREPPHRREE
jgi:isopentenyl-diphosphate delta-isomerase